MTNKDYFIEVIEFKKKSGESLQLLKKLIRHNVQVQKYELAALQRDIEKKLEESYRGLINLERDNSSTN